MEEKEIIKVDHLKDIKEAVIKETTIFGKDITLKTLRDNGVEKIYMSKNIPVDLKDEIANIANLNKVEVIQLEVFNDELGTVCKKPFAISVLAIKKV